MAEISWIKLSVNIFDDEKIRLIRTMPEGDSILLVWIQLLCLAGKTNDKGRIYISEGMNYSDEMLAEICRQPLSVIRIALKVFSDFDMVEVSDDRLISINNWEKYQNIDGMKRVKDGNALRQRKKYYLDKIKEEMPQIDLEQLPEHPDELKDFYNKTKINNNLT